MDSSNAINSPNEATNNDLVDERPNSSSSSSGASSSHETSDLELDHDALLAAKLAQEYEERAKDCASDLALALMLQREFDTEFNKQLKKQEDRLNGSSKVGVSLDNFRRKPSDYETDPLDDRDDDTQSVSSETQGTWDAFELRELKQKGRMMGRSGFVLDQDGNMITKHDIPTASRRNVCRLMESKGDIETGDAGAKKDDFMLNNYVYNRLKVHSKKSSKRSAQKAFDKRERENVNSNLLPEELQSCKLNENTKSIMDGLLVAYKIEKLNGVIGLGKESTVLHATGRDHNDKPGQEVAIKIFNSDMSVAFKTRDSYNKSKCPSYKFDKPKSKHDSLNKWAERGFKNLKLLRKSNINCPDAISLKKHVLVMTFLGTNASPSPKLKDASLTEQELQDSYDQVVDIMCRMYNECNLIHGDLSEYNLLWHNNQIYVIDVSQSMFTSHPAANRFLYRDCENVLEFYRKAGLSKLANVNELFTTISGKDLNNKDIEFWCKAEDFPRNEKLSQSSNHSAKKNTATDTLNHLLETTAQCG